MTKIYQIPFHGNQITLIGFNGQPYIAVKPICEHLGIKWQGQLARIHKSVDIWQPIMLVVPINGKNTDLHCLPKSKLFAWLMTIQPGRTTADIEIVLNHYQRECDDLIDAFWKKQITNQDTFFSVELLEDFKEFLNVKYPNSNAVLRCLTLESATTIEQFIGNGDI